jgi:hypothetical protein
MSSPDHIQGRGALFIGASGAYPLCLLLGDPTALDHRIESRKESFRRWDMRTLGRRIVDVAPQVAVSR